MTNDYFVANPANDTAIVTSAAPTKARAGGTGASHKVALTLSNLPKRRDNAGATWPRTPSKIDPQVSIPPSITHVSASPQPSDLVTASEQNPPWPAFRGYHEYSFAHATMGHRLPTILGKAVDDVIRTLNEQSAEEEVVDLVRCIERMEGLMADLSGNANLRYIVDGQCCSYIYCYCSHSNTPL